MILLYVALLIVCLWGMRLRKPNDGECSYLDKTQTKAIQGVFVVIVLFSHFSSYVTMENRLDEWFVFINNRIGQLMVTMFLFYSGYGIMQSIKRKGEDYVKGFLRHRVMPVYGRFFVSVILFLIVDAALGLLGDTYSLVDCLLAFTAWTSIGNSTWFMFATFMLYAFVFVSFRLLIKKDLKIPLSILTALTLGYILAFSLLIQRGAWWYNTILCFPFGMWFSYYLGQVEKIRKNNKLYAPTFLTMAALFFALYLLQDRLPFAWGYCLMSLAFTALVILFTMRVAIGNKILNFFGSHVFSIYMLQRLTYIIFEPIIHNAYLFFIICFTLTICIAVLFDFACDQIARLIKQRHVNKK